MISVVSETAKPVRIPPDFVQYAEKHKIFELNKKLLTLLIVDRPDDPIAYLIDTLTKDINDVPSVFIFGPKASGKSTLAQLLSDKFGSVIIYAEDIYDLCSDRINTSPRDLAIALKKRLKEPDCVKNGYILVGFPIHEAEAKSLCWEGVFPDCAVFLEAPLATLVERASGMRIDPKSGEQYHLISHPPPSVDVESRLSRLPGYDYESLKTHYDGYVREAVLLKNIYKAVSKIINADQPITDLFHFVFEFIYQPPRNIALRTPRIILLGFPGSGKKTQADLLSKKYGLILVDCGRLVLQEVANRSTIGKVMDTYVQKHLPVPDDIISEVLKNRLNQIDCSTNGWVLLGYPRTCKQAALLDSNSLAPNRVMFLDIPHICAADRLTGRRIESITGARFHVAYAPQDNSTTSVRSLQHPDDQECVVGSRLARFAAHRDALMEYYANCLVKINGNQDVHTVFEEIESRLVNELPTFYLTN